MILVRDQYRYERLSDNRISYPEYRLKRSRTLNPEIIEPAGTKMCSNCAFCGIDRITLCIDVRCNASRMTPPVIQYLRNMNDILGFLRQTKDHVMILASVKFGPERSALFNKFFGEH